MVETSASTSPITTLLNDTNTWANRRNRINALTTRIQELQEELEEDDENYVHPLYLPALIEGRERLCEMYLDRARVLVERWRALQAEADDDGDCLSGEEKEKLQEIFQKLLEGGTPVRRPGATRGGNGEVLVDTEHRTDQDHGETSSTAPVQADGGSQFEGWRLFGERIR